jgi:hypothetical protein
VRQRIVVQLQQPERRVGLHPRVRHTLIVVRAAGAPTGSPELLPGLRRQEEHTAGPGTVAVLPRRLRHAYVVISATARFLTLHAPAGFEQIAAEVGQPARALSLPPEPQDRRISPP